MLLPFLTLVLSLAFITLATPFPVPTAQTSTIPLLTPTPTIAPRCGDGDCTFAGTATTLPATTTILSTTSVPCYITTYITDSTTVTSTVYSTATITSTVTSEGTVWIYQFSPTPYLFSSTYESTLQITETLTTYWQSDIGVGEVSTYTASPTMNTGGGGDGGGWGTSVTTTQATGNAWTHAGSGGAAPDNAGTRLATTLSEGWQTAAGPVTGNQGGGAVVNWSAGSKVVTRSISIAVCVGSGVMLLIVW
jgi:hypothetical protein